MVACDPFWRRFAALLLLGSFEISKTYCFIVKIKIKIKCTFPCLTTPPTGPNCCFTAAPCPAFRKKIGVLPVCWDATHTYATGVNHGFAVKKQNHLDKSEKRVPTSSDKTHPDASLWMHLRPCASGCVWWVSAVTGSWLKDFFPSGFDKRSRWGFCEVCFQLQPRYPRSPHSLRLQPLYPPQPAVHGLFAISSKRLIVLLWWRQERKKKTMDLSRVCVSWNARPQVSGYNTQRNNKLGADHRSNMQYWWPASPVATAAVIVSN